MSNSILADQTIQALWLKNSDVEEIRPHRHTAVDALANIKPGDDLKA
jgi:hypothetical protein